MTEAPAQENHGGPVAVVTNSSLDGEVLLIGALLISAGAAWGPETKDVEMGEG